MIKHEDGSVTLTKEEYESLLREKAKLMALQNAGVDNWEGYEFVYEYLPACEKRLGLEPKHDD